MGLLKKLQGQGSLLSAGNGATPTTTTDLQSKLHYSYSIDGTPNMPKKPQPSKLDLNGKTPSKYTDNLPG